LQSGKTILVHDIYSAAKYVKCVLHWIPAHVGVEENEFANRLANAGHVEEQNNVVTCSDANALAHLAIRGFHVKQYKHVPAVDLKLPRAISSCMARLRTGHYKWLKSLTDGTRTYRNCRNCKNIPLSPQHIYACPTITPLVENSGIKTE